MKTAYVFLANGCEELEAITIIDILRRAEIEVKTISINKEKEVRGAHNIGILADDTFDNNKFIDADLYVLPGGMDGTINLSNHLGLSEILKKANERNAIISAICAAPMVLNKFGLLKDKSAVCYPGLENMVSDAKILNENIVEDSNIITSMGPATAMKFALYLVTKLHGEECSKKVSNDMLCHRV